MKPHNRYDFTGEALRAFRQATIYNEVDDLDPDGFTADEDTAESIIEGINFDNDIIKRDNGWILIDGPTIVGRIEKTRLRHQK